MDEKKFIKASEFSPLYGEYLKKLNIEEIAIVHNPSYIFFPVEMYPMAPKVDKLESLKAVVMDMDGTTTTTEPLCLHSLEYMVRKITGREEVDEWSGLDREKDYPNVIGNSTTKHVEYLITTYRNWIKEERLINAFIESVLWTLTEGEAEDRKSEVLISLRNLSDIDVFKDNKFKDIISKEEITEEEREYFFKIFENKISINNNFEKIVRASIDIYYARYHFILKEISNGLHREEKLIKPMPGTCIYLALITGLLGEEADRIYDLFIEELKKKNENIDYDIISSEKLKRIGLYFESNPVKVGIVTSSIFYEANIVLNEIFRIFRQEIERWNISHDRKDRILRKYSSYSSFYNTVITATDSSEIRLKPHRDLYAMALHRLGINPEEFNKVVGFEDSESGTIAIRSAGIGLSVAVPFTDTNFHNFYAATKVVYGGLPEVILRFSHWLDL